MTEREKMLAGQLYDCGDGELLNQWHKAKDLIRDYNRTDSANAEEKKRILQELLGGQESMDYRTFLCRLRKQYLFRKQLRGKYELYFFR